MKKKNLSKNINIICVLLFGIMCVPSCTPREEEGKLSGSYEKKLISYKEGTLLYDEYSKTNNEILTKFRNGEPDSRWYWLSLEDLEGYIQYVKQNAKEQKLENLGLRIYLGKYPLDYPKEKMAKPEYAGYQTIFIVPTTKSSVTGNVKQLSRATSIEENINITSMAAMNMVNLAPPPKIKDKIE